MILVTGGAGFIGANIVKKLNESGREDILIVDNLENSKKQINLNNLKFIDFVDKRDFISNIDSFKDLNIEILFHQGACSNTMEYNGRYMIDNNYQYSKKLLHFALYKNIRFIYASSAAVYGNGDNGFKEVEECEYPLNVYGYSKLLFDNYVRKILKSINVNNDYFETLKKINNYFIYDDYFNSVQNKENKFQIVGLRYFNVYGPMENHKGKMASVIYHFFNQIKSENTIKLFEGSENYKRDFIFVDDIVNINMFFYQHPEISGIFNAGTGIERSFYDIAKIVNQKYSNSKIEFIPFPEVLKGKYQAFTKADITKLKRVGYDNKFHSLEEGVNKYLDYLEKNKEIL